MKFASRTSILILTLLFTQNLTAQAPSVHIWALTYSGKANPAIDVTSDSDVADLKSRLTDLPSSPPTQESILGWGGFLLENRGITSFPAQINVLFGVIEVIESPGAEPEYFQDTKGLNDLIKQLGAGVFPPQPASLHTITEDCPAPVPGLPTNGSEPPYQPDHWNQPGVQGENNCYNYAANKMATPPEESAQPGLASGREPGYKPFNCWKFIRAANGDGFVQRECDKVCRKGTFKIALVLDPNRHDYHWYQQNDKGDWSHKPGGGKATSLDSCGHPITDPRHADRRERDDNGDFTGIEYSEFCECFCVDPAKINIKGHVPEP